MRFLFLIVSVAVAGAVAVAAAVQFEKSTMECKPGTAFTKECNTCVCSKDGMHHICTLMNCPSSADEPHQRAVHQTEEDDASGHVGQVIGNTLLRKIRQISHNRACVPGERFNVYCNTCTCGSDGFSVACTKTACPGDLWNEDGSFKNPRQVSSNGLLRKTREISDGRLCVPGERFQKYCNSCTCGTDGFSVACTRMACPREIWNEDGSLKRRYDEPNVINFWGSDNKPDNAV